MPVTKSPLVDKAKVKTTVPLIGARVHEYWKVWEHVTDLVMSAFSWTMLARMYSNMNSCG